VIILDILHRAEKHITPEEIYEQVQLKYPEVNKSTVYRTLELLKKLDLVTETDLGGDKLYYHHAEKGHHHHLICQKCGKVFDVEEEAFDPLEEILVRNYNFIPDMKHLAIFGHCLTCE
jgi:Fur family ferric uptake transcriptional regulator